MFCFHPRAIFSVEIFCMAKSYKRTAVEWNCKTLDPVYEVQESRRVRRAAKYLVEGDSQAGFSLAPDFLVQGPALDGFRQYQRQ